jgi:hypothetical protein
VTVVPRRSDRSLIAIALLTVLLATSCKDGNELTGKNMPVPSKAPPEGFDVDTSKRPVVEELDAGPPKGEATPSAKSGRPALTPSEVEELGESLPELDNSLTMKALAVVPHSRIATFTACLKLSLTEATSQLVRAYQAKGWSDLKVSTPTHDEERRTVSANSKVFRMTGTVGGGGTIGCPDDKTHTKVALRFQERSPAPAATGLELNLKLPKKGVLRHGSPDARRPAPGTESPPPTPRD